MKQVFMPLTMCLLLASAGIAQTNSKQNESTLSPDDERQLEKQVQEEIGKFERQDQETRLKEIVSIGKMGKLTANGTTYFIVDVGAYISLHPTDGIEVDTMDQDHQLYRTLFSASYLKGKGIDVRKFIKKLKSSKTTVACNNDGPHDMGPWGTYLYCAENFEVQSK